MDLIAEMKQDKRELDSQEKALLWALRAILVAFWFYQVDELWQHIAGWNVRNSDFVMEDAAELSRNFLEAEAAEISAADAAIDEYRADPTTEIPLEDAVKEWERGSIDERVKRILDK